MNLLVQVGQDKLRMLLYIRLPWTCWYRLAKPNYDDSLTSFSLAKVTYYNHLKIKLTFHVWITSTHERSKTSVIPFQLLFTLTITISKLFLKKHVMKTRFNTPKLFCFVRWARRWSTQYEFEYVNKTIFIIFRTGDFTMTPVITSTKSSIASI